MLGQLDSNFNSIFGVRSHTLVAEQGATSYFNSSEEEDEDDDIDILESEYGITKEDFSRISAELDEEEDLEELDFED